MKNKFNKVFWIYRTGQFFSGIGDICFEVALYWWLVKTLEVYWVGLILSSVMILEIIVSPLIAPVGDRFSRKKNNATSFIFSLYFGPIV